jgi:hypothetical protein
VFIPVKLWQAIFGEVSQLLDDIIEAECSLREPNREAMSKGFKDRMFVIVKMMAFAFSESGSDFVMDKFELQFYHIRDELIEAIEGDKGTVQSFHSMLMERGVWETNQLLLYLLKKLHLFRQQKQKKRAEKRRID